MIRTLLLIFLGGGTGSVLRYLTGLWCSSLGSMLHFPAGTFAANVVGCFLIGLFNGIASRFGLAEDVRLMLTVGLCGGFTTFSTFSNEMLGMITSGNYLQFLAYLLLCIITGLCAVVLGSWAIN